jgi:uroporphyrinogen-III synthase
LAGDGLASFLQLPCYAVGEATAQAARGIGFGNVSTGPGDAQALIQQMAQGKLRRVFHPAGLDHVPVEAPFEFVKAPVYAAHAVAFLPETAVNAVREGALVLIHSPRAASVFAALLDQSGIERGRVALAAISEAAAVSASLGWKSVAVAARPRDEALLELAAKLCQTEAS